MFSHTSVPWEKPEIRTSSEKFLGLVSSSMPRTKGVPYSGSPRAPTVTPLFPITDASCWGVMPSASVELKRESVFLSSKGMDIGSIPVISWSIRMTFGSS